MLSGHPGPSSRLIGPALSTGLFRVPPWPPEDAERQRSPRCHRRAGTGTRCSWASPSTRPMSYSSAAGHSWVWKPSVHRELLTGVHLMLTGKVEANSVRLIEEARLPHVTDLIARKLAGPSSP